MARSFSELPLKGQIAVVVIVPVLLAAIVYWYKVRPLAGQREQLDTQVKALDAQNLANRVFERQRIVNLQRLEQLQNQLTLLRNYVPDEPDTDGFIRLLLDTSTATGVHVRSLAAGAEVNHEQYTEEPFKLRLDGTYFPILDFFGRLARARRLVSVTGLSLATPSTGGGPGAYTIPPGETVGANCVVTTYFKSSAAQQAPVARK